MNYYKTALDKCYDVDDPRTWKSVCVKRNKADNVLFVLVSMGSIQGFAEGNRIVRVSNVI